MAYGVKSYQVYSTIHKILHIIDEDYLKKINRTEEILLRKKILP